MQGLAVRQVPVVNFALSKLIAASESQHVPMA